MGNLCSRPRAESGEIVKQYPLHENNKRERKEAKNIKQQGEPDPPPQDLDIEALGDAIERLN